MRGAVRRRLGTVALAAGVLCTLLPGSPARTEPDLSQPGLEEALRCGASLAGRQAVLLVHGTGVTPEENWSWGFEADLPARARPGGLPPFGVCTVQLPNRALNDIQESTEYVVHAVRRMYEMSGRRVHLLGHSQGGLQPRWALRWWPSLRDMVDDVVSLGSPHHGTQAAETPFPYTCEACWQMRRDSRLIAALNAWDETPGDGVSYTSIWTQYDELVQPPTSANYQSRFPGDANFSNIRIQDRGGFCSNRTTDHGGLAGDAVAHAAVLDAFNTPGPAVLSRIPASACMQASFTSTPAQGSAAFQSVLGAMLRQWTQEGGSLAFGARYASAEPEPAGYVRSSELTVSAPDEAVATGTIEVSARLTDLGGRPLQGREIAFGLGGSTASATTDADGTAVGSLDVDHDAGPAELTASFMGDGTYEGAFASHALLVTHMPTLLSVDAPASGQVTDPVAVTATLIDAEGTPLAGRSVDIALAGASAGAVTGADGSGAAKLVVDADAGTSEIRAAFAGDGRYAASSSALPFEVEPEDTVLTYLGEDHAKGSQVPVSARLTEADGAPLQGRALELRVGAATATAVTDADGVGSAVLSVPDHGRSQPVLVTFAGDARYVPSSVSGSVGWGRH